MKKTIAFTLTALLALFAIACTTDRGLAPDSLAGKRVEYNLTTASGKCAAEQDKVFVTVFNPDNTFQDIDATGAVVESGTYEYVKSKEDKNKAKIRYSITSEGDYKGSAFHENVKFSAAQMGAFEGEQETLGDCKYSGTFRILLTQ